MRLDFQKWPLPVMSGPLALPTLSQVFVFLVFQKGHSCGPSVELQELMLLTVSLQAVVLRRTVVPQVPEMGRSQSSEF